MHLRQFGFTIGLETATSGLENWYTSQLCVWLETNLNFMSFWKRILEIKSKSPQKSQLRPDFMMSSFHSSCTLLSWEWTLCSKDCKFGIKETFKFAIYLVSLQYEHIPSLVFTRHRKDFYIIRKTFILSSAMEGSKGFLSCLLPTETSLWNVNME